jgi:hypothetical protein
MRVNKRTLEKKLYNEEIRVLYSSLSIIRVSVRVEGHVTRMENKTISKGLGGESCWKEQHLKSQGVDGSIIIKWK